MQTREPRQRHRRHKGSLTFEELSDKAKAVAIDAHRDWEIDAHDWWDYVYEDARRMASLIGIEINEIRFTGFWNQGDGASFTGAYAWKPDCIEAIKSECEDEKLIAFATELTVLQTTMKLLYDVTYECTISRIYSSIMVTDFNLDLPEYIFKIDKQFQDIMRRFADWIYAQLKAEYDYLTSDEHISEMLTDSHLRFDELGATI